LPRVSYFPFAEVGAHPKRHWALGSAPYSSPYQDFSFGRENKYNKKNYFLIHSLLWIAGQGAPTKATSAFPQLTVQHLAGCPVLAGAMDANLPHSALSLPRCWVKSQVYYEPCWKTSNPIKKKEVTLGKKLALCLGTAPLDTRQPFWKRSCSRRWGKAESLHCLSKSNDSKEAGLSRHENG